MKKFRFTELQDVKEGHILSSVLPGRFIYTGGLGFSQPGARSHTKDGPGKTDCHVHDDCELFFIFQGKGQLELNKEYISVTAGDIVIVEPGEDHHMISDKDDPLVTLWCHAGPERHVNQR